MLSHRRRVRRHLLIATLALGLAACGGRIGASSPAADDPTGAPTTQAITDAAPMGTPPVQTPTPTLDLPDLSAIESDLSAIDGELAADASGPIDEGSDQ